MPLRGFRWVVLRHYGLACNHLDKFAYLGAFSPAIAITDITKDYSGILADVVKVNRQLRLLWLGIGTDDFLFGPVKQSHETLQRAGINHVWVESSGAHVWTVWRKYLADFAPRLFHDSAIPNGWIGRSPVGPVAIRNNAGRSPDELRIHDKRTWHRGIVASRVGRIFLVSKRARLWITLG